MMFENVCMPTGNRFSRFVSISAKTFYVTMSFIRRQSYKKTLEFACLLGKKWLIKKNVDNSLLFTRRPTLFPFSWRGSAAAIQTTLRLYIKRRCGCVASFFCSCFKKIFEGYAISLPKNLVVSNIILTFALDICKWLNSFGLLSQ